MEVNKANQVLEQILLQAVTDETYFRTLGAVGIRMADWPQQFSVAARFERAALGGTHRAAVVQVPVDVPEKFWSRDRLGVEDTKALYPEALDTLTGVEMARLIMREPSKHREIVARLSSRRAQSEGGRMRLNDVIGAYVADVKRRQDRGVEFVTLKGFEKFSEVIEGFEPGRVTIVTAKSGFGKTNLGLQMFANSTECGIRSLYLNQEMVPEDVGKRLVKMRAGRTSKQLRGDGILFALQSSDVASWAVENHEHWITDGRSLSMNDVERHVTELRRDQGLQMVFVDYDQKVLMERTDSEDREWMAMKRLVEQLEEMSKREMVHTVLFSQANEDGLPRASERAMQPASVVAWFNDEGGQDNLRFVKNRHGRQGAVLGIRYEREISRITEGDLDEGTRTEKQPTGLKLPNMAQQRARP